MNVRHLARVASTCALLAGSVLATSTAASAQAPTIGCPHGFFHWSVAGNGDGCVCAHLLGVTENGRSLYEFFDDVLPASSK